MLSRKGLRKMRGWRRRNTHLLLGAGVWSVIVGASLGISLRLERQSVLDLALAEARMAGQALTLISPSLMARQAHDFGRSGNGIRGHITSLNPVSPKNRPDDWQRNARKRLAAGAAETSEVRDIDGRGYLRLMRSLVIEQNCLQCHAGQGYKLGDIRGGLSVDVPMVPLWDAQRPHVLTIVAGYGVIWLTGLGALALTARALQRRAREGRESEATFRDLFDNAPVAYHEIDRDGVIRRVNRAECVLLGFEAGEMVGRPVWEFVAEADRKASLDAICRKISGAQPLAPFERRYVRRDGGELLLEIHDSLVRNATGETAGIRTALVDITGRKRAEEALRESAARLAESNQLLAGVLEHTHMMAAFLDPRFNFIWVNRAYADTCRHAPSFFPGKNHFDLYPHAENQAIFQRAVDTGEPFLVAAKPFEFPDQPERGVTYWDWSLIPVKDDAGKVAGLVFTLAEVTERIRAEEALRESEERFRLLVTHAGEGVGFVDLEERFQFANPAAEAIFGVSANGLVGRNLKEFLAPGEFRRVLEESGKRRHNVESCYELEILRPDGAKRQILVTAAPSATGEGEIEGTFGVFRDITERRRMEEERGSLQLQLAQAQKMETIGRLAGGVAHDFNNLLTVINGYSQLLLAKLSAGDLMRPQLAEIHKAGERAAALTRQLLAFGRKQVLEPRVLDLNRVVEEMWPMLARLLGEAVEVRVALNAESGTVRADPHQLEQVLMNLAVNARDAMPGGGRLLIETAGVERDESYARSHLEARAGRYVMLAVSDNGVGMDEEAKKRIFEPFFTTKGVGQGTGLGLSMVQGIVAQSGGYINVYSEPGQGTTFRIYLPALAEAAADAGRPAAVPALGGKETVLVVEDQAEVRDYAVAVLKAYGYRVIQAENAGEALMICEREHGRIHLLLTDVVMPNVSGRELADRLEKMRPGIKVLFMSGYTDNVIVHHGVLEEGAKFIQKPFSPEDLAGKVRAVLGPPAPAARILVADDEAGVRGFLRAVLEQGGYEVIEAADGKQALRQARAGDVDLVITDLVMPEQEGIETIQALREEMPGIGIIAISGAFGGQLLKTAQMLGADAVLTKPVSAELLLARVAEVLKR